MKVLIFGATGETGKQLVSQALQGGHEITAFVRDPGRFQMNGRSLRVVQGNIVNRAALESVIHGQDAVISALGSRTLMHRQPEIVLGIHNIVLCMELIGTKRFIYLSADVVREARQDFNFIRKYVVPYILKNPTADHEISEEMIRQSHLEWLIVRPPRLTNGSHRGTYRTGERLISRSLIPQISRADLAEFMLQQLSSDTFLHKAPTIMY